jgi:hypothetical protein
MMITFVPNDGHDLSMAQQATGRLRGLALGASSRRMMGERAVIFAYANILALAASARQYVGATAFLEGEATSPHDVSDGPTGRRDHCG